MTRRTVHVLARCAAADRVSEAVEALRSIAIGFPTADVAVTDSGSCAEASAAFETLAAQNGYRYKRLSAPTRRYIFLSETILNPAHTGAAVIVGPNVVFHDTCERWTFDAAKSRSKSHNTPFDRWQLTGKVVATIVAGRIVYRSN